MWCQHTIDHFCTLNSASETRIWKSDLTRPADVATWQYGTVLCNGHHHDCLCLSERINVFSRKWPCRLLCCVICFRVFKKETNCLSLHVTWLRPCLSLCLPRRTDVRLGTSSHLLCMSHLKSASGSIWTHPNNSKIITVVSFLSYYGM